MKPQVPMAQRAELRLLIVGAVTLAALAGAGSAFAQCNGGAGAQTGLASVSCSGVAAWSNSTAYAVNAQVTYNNCLYKYNQAVGAGLGWTPGQTGVYFWGNGSACGAAGCNYGAQGPCSGGGGPTPTNTPTPTATNTPTPTPTTPPGGGGNLALNKSATGSAACNANEGPAKAVNGTTNGGNTDKFCSGSGPIFLQVDLGQSYTLGSFVVKHAGAGGEGTNYNTRDFTIQVSANASSWTTVVTVNGNTASTTTHNISATAGRYIKLNVTAGEQGGGLATRIYEFEAYGGSSATPTSTSTPTATATATPAPGGTPCANCTHKRLKIMNECGGDMWIQYLNGNGGGSLTSPNHHKLSGLHSFIEYDIPDKGIAGVRFWPSLGCDGTGNNCTVGASGGPASMGFTCPEAGCGPPVDSKFEATFGCMDPIATGSCQTNPSGSGPLGRVDWWNSSAVDGYTLPMRVEIPNAGSVCAPGAAWEGPGGPPGGFTTCQDIRFSDCPANENLSSSGAYPALSAVNLKLTNPANNQQAGCFSPVGKLTYSQWNAGFTTYPPPDDHAKWYACPTPPISPAQCSGGPANSTAYRNLIHAKCTNTYAYAYDDTFGLATCNATTSLQYVVKFYCPQ